MSGLIYSSLSDGTFKSILDVNDVLERIRDEVKLLLHKKQENCSRLCFMGYDSLIIFLRDITKRSVLNISQLFPGIESIDISENYISSVKRSNYQLELVRHVTLFAGNKLLPLDNWVSDLENMLILTFKEKIKKINVENEEWWKTENDMQILVVAEMIFFSSNIENPNLIEKIENWLNNIIVNIKTGDIYLEKLALIMISQISLLKSMKTDPICMDFTLKYSTNPDLRLTVMNYSIDFCYEFHNLSEHSYIPTPVTEKLMLHIVNSVVTHQTILLFGQSNSGKTSTLRELALYCGKGICFWTSVRESTFNVLMSIVSGCATGGFWGVIEEIQNLEISVLSTITHYLTDIIQKMSMGQNKIIIDDKYLKTKQGFSMFFTSSNKDKLMPSITQNLRTISLIQPDFKQIIKMKLEALGYSSLYFHQISLIFELIANNFESTDSRKSKSAISHSVDTLNTLFRYFPSELNESSIVSAFYQLYSSELSPANKKILTEILTSVFPGNEIILNEVTIQDRFKSYGLNINKELSQIIEMTLEMIKSKHKWLIITGPACSGKSALIGIAALEYSKIISKDFLLHKLNDVDSDTLLKLISLCDKVGDSKYSYCSYPIGDAKLPSGNDWIVLDARMNLNWDTLNYISRGEVYINASRKVLVPKGLKLFIECENMNDLTPGDLKNSNIISLNEELIPPIEIFISMLKLNNMEDLTEIYVPLYNNLVKAVYFGLTNTYFNYSLKIWTLQIMRLIGKMVKEARSLMSKKYDSLYTQIYRSPKSHKMKTPLGSSILASNVEYRDMYVPQQVDKKGEIIANTIEFLNLSRNPPVINTKSMFEGIFLCAVIYTFGTCTKDRQKFHRVILDFLNRQGENFAGNIKEKIKLKSVFDLCYLIETQEWLEWDENLVKNKRQTLARQLTLRKSTRALIEVSKSIDLLYIPTSDSKKYIYWLSYYLTSGISSILLGLHQCGKTLLATSILKKQLGQGYLGYLPISLTSNTTVSNIQSIICTSLDQIKEHYYTCVGGVKQYVYIDDLNLDSSNNIYELLRFWKENHGWYNQDFCFIGQMEILAVHGYSANRSLYPRAIRHFNIIYKEPYSASDISLIFRNIVDSDIVSISQSREDLFSVLDLSVDFYKKLFSKMQRISSERFGYNLSLTVFIMALRKTAELRSLDTYDTEDYIKVFTFIFKTYISSQVSPLAKEISDVLETSYLSFLAEFQGDITDDSQIEPSSILIDPYLFNGLANDYMILNKELLLKTIEGFDQDIEKAKAKSFDNMKYMHYLFNKPEDTLGRYLLTYFRLLFDLKDSTNCSIVISESSNKILKALALTAAERLEMPLYNFTQSQTHSKDFTVIHEFYLPVEAKYMLKEVVNSAGVLDKQVIVLIEAQEHYQDLYTISILEIFNDIFSASTFKIPACYKYYRDIISKLKFEGINQKNIYNEQVMMSILEKIKENVKILIIAESKFYSFSRTEPISILEQLKHRCRSLFNCSKIICYDSIVVPYSILEGIVIQDTVLNKWLNKYNKSIYTDFYLKAGQITGEKFFNDYQLEKLAYLTNEIMITNETRYNEHIDKLKYCNKRIDKIEVEIESFGEKVASIVKDTETLQKQVKELHTREEDYLKKNHALHSSSYVPPFVQEFEQEKKDFFVKLDKAKSEFDEAKESLLASKGDFAELTMISNPQPGLTACAAYLQYLSTPKVKFPQNITLDALESLAKSFLNNLVFNFSSIVKKIRKIVIENVIIIEEMHTHPLLMTYNGAKGVKCYRLLMKFIENIWKYKKNHEEYILRKVDWAKTEENQAADVKIAIEEVSTKLLSELAEINDSKSKIQDKISTLQETQENIEKIRPKAQKIIRNLNQRKIKWIEDIASLEKTRESLYSDSVFITFKILIAYEYPNPIRQQLIEEASIMIQSRDSTFPGIPKCPSAYFSHLLELQMIGKKWKGYHILSSTSFFQETVAGIRSAFTFYLPYPYIIDPFKVFQEFVTIEEEDDLALLTLEAGFEQLLDRQMTGGKAALIISPSPSMHKALENLINTRMKYCMNRYRGLPCDNLTIRIANQLIEFNPNFRLYICGSQPTPEINEKFTVFSMELEGIEWKNMLFSKIQQNLDAVEYATRLDVFKNSVVNKDQGNQDDKEAIEILHMEIDSQDSLSFFDFLQKIGKIILSSEHELTKVQKSMIKEESEIEIIECPEALDELYRFHKILSFTNSLTKPYTLYPSTLIDMIIDSIRELNHNSTDLLLVNQLNSSVDIIVYILLSWIYSSMPSYCGLIFVMYFAMNKFMDISPEYTDEISQLFKDIHDIKSSTAEQVVKELREKYLNLLPEGFSALFLTPLETHELYRDCRLPKSISPAIKLFIYSRMRLDLIPLVAYEILTDLMGYRYTYLPPPLFHKIALYCEATRPIIVIYEENSPIELIRTECEEMTIRLEVIQPLLKASTGGNGKKETIMINCKNIIKPLLQKNECKKWIVIENANVINPKEIETLMRAIQQATSNPWFKVLLLVQGDINNYPHLMPIIEGSYRMYFKAPETIKERVTDWFCWTNKEYYTRYRQNILEKYHYHLSSSPSVASKLFSKKTMNKDVLKKLSTVLAFPSQTSSILSFEPGEFSNNTSLVQQIPYNMSLFTSFLHLRGIYTEDSILNYTDTQHLLKELPSYLNTLDSNIRHQAISKFVSLFWNEEYGELFDSILNNVNSVSIVVGNKSVTYPLYGATKRDGFEAIDTLINLMSSEDHLKIVGLNHDLLKAKELIKGKHVLKFIPQFLMMMKPMVLSLHIRKSLKISEVARTTEALEHTIIEYKLLLPESFAMEIKTNDPIIKLFSYHELKDFEELYNEVISKLTIISFYMLYDNSRLSKNDSKIFYSIMKDEIPKVWKKMQPYCLRNCVSFTSWLKEFNNVLSFPLIGDLNYSYNPARLFYFFIRNNNYPRFSIIAKPIDKGIRGIGIKNAIIEKGFLCESNHFFNELPDLFIDIDRQNRYEGNYIYFEDKKQDDDDEEENDEKLIEIPIFKCENIVFLVKSKMTQRYCKFKRICADTR